jgi:GR25 family glycosyltransferase involved in LPS biosynthesis
MITAYIITDTRSEFSSNLAEKTQAALDHYGWSHYLWPAVNGFALTELDWQRLNISLLDLGKTRHRPGAQGCIHSHFTLWQHCVTLAEPIVVLEHDAVAQGEFPLDLPLDRCVWKLWAEHLPRENHVTGTWSKGSHAYTLTPTQAQALIDFSRQHGVQAVDKQLGTEAVAWQGLDRDLFKHCAHTLSSTALPIYLG